MRLVGEYVVLPPSTLGEAFGEVMHLAAHLAAHLAHLAGAPCLGIEGRGPGAGGTVRRAKENPRLVRPGAGGEGGKS